jgi:hypothetical protein
MVRVHAADLVEVRTFAHGGGQKLAIGPLPARRPPPVDSGGPGPPFIIAGRRPHLVHRKPHRYPSKTRAYSLAFHAMSLAAESAERFIGNHTSGRSLGFRAERILVQRAFSLALRGNGVRRSRELP